MSFEQVAQGIRESLPLHTSDEDIHKSLQALIDKGHAKRQQVSGLPAEYYATELGGRVEWDDRVPFTNAAA
jgi:hypothetical protein